MEVTVKDRQSLLDIAVQTLGGIEGVFALAERNGIGITDRLEDGAVLEWDVSDIVDSTVQTFYSNRGLSPATDITEAELKTLLSEVTEEAASDDADDGEVSFDDTSSEHPHELTNIFTDEFESVFA